ncbi:MAG TPA: LysM peptidoglycan-binding domain-containing protein, partial [Chthoniobacterales bacterium]
YEEMSEPNMKLSRALLIVLVLHVVAVAGIIAFNTIKSRQGIVPPPATAKTVVQKSTMPATATTESAKPREESATKPAVKEERKAILVKPVVENTPKPESKKTYTVAKGDTPVSIAKKFKITSDQLLAANKIEDAHKLKIGQKLVIPAPKEKSAPKEKKKSKKSD